MKRSDIRRLKRSASRCNDVEAMQALLARSVQFGHRRLTLVLCRLVEKMGGQASPEILRYCQGVADSMPRELLEKIMCRVVAASITGKHGEPI